jgi:hypothetical protein
MKRRFDNLGKAHWRLAALAAASALLLALGDEGAAQNDSTLAAFRKDPAYAALYREGKAFLALPLARQQAMRKLHQDLERLPTAERERLKGWLAKYADWLDGLPTAQRQEVMTATDKTSRLRKIKEIREQQWIARQPIAIRRQLGNPPPAAVAATVGLLVGTPRPMRILAAATAMAEGTDLRAEIIHRAKKEEAARARDWVIAARHWDDLTGPKRPAMPTSAADFGKELEDYIKDYLRPVLSKGEQQQLDKAEGHWPKYPVTLVELAERHPMALPHKTGPNAFKDLPPEVQTRVLKVFDDTKEKGKIDSKKGNKAKQPETFFRNDKNIKAVDLRLKEIHYLSATASMKFACAVATFAHSKGVRMPYEMWAARPTELSNPMKVFLDPKGPFVGRLTSEERGQLSGAEGKWPEYPLKVRDLASKYGFHPPWQILPDIGGKEEVWDRYRLKGLAGPED